MRIGIAYEAVHSRLRAGTFAVVLLLGMGACASAPPHDGLADRSASTTTSTLVGSTTTSTSTTQPAPTTSAPTTSVVPTTTSGPPATTAIPRFTGTVATLTAADLPSSYRAGCPVGPDQLRMLRMSYWGFDNQPHVGSMVVNSAVTQAVLTVFERLYDARFPIRRMVPVDAYGGSDPKSMDADNTSGFNCRNTVASGPPRWSAHAYGEAIDVNTIENPYVQAGVASPDAGAAYLDRSDHRAGMAYYGGALVDAFAAVGWQWGGRWSDPDYQHFSATGG